MDVIGDNIVNVNIVGFKLSRVIFVFVFVFVLKLVLVFDIVFGRGGLNFM